MSFLLINAFIYNANAFIAIYQLTASKLQKSQRLYFHYQPPHRLHVQLCIKLEVAKLQRTVAQISRGSQNLFGGRGCPTTKPPAMLVPEIVSERLQGRYSTRPEPNSFTKFEVVSFNACRNT